MPILIWPSRLEFVEGGQRLAVEPDHAAGVAEQPLAVVGQPVGAPVLLEELLADALLQPAHLHRNGRLRAVHLVGGTGEAAGIGNGHECLELVQIERSRHGRTIINVDDKD